MAHSSKALQQYLARYAEPEASLLAGFPASFQRCIVVPVYREPSAFLRRFIAFIEQQGDCLLIIVSNRPDTESNIDSSTDTITQWHRDLVESIHYPIRWVSSDKVQTLYKTHNGSAILLVDRVLVGRPIPAREGVGTARKIGADIACQLIARHYIRSPWIACTDADAHLPDNYFKLQPAGQTSRQPIAALIYPYQHVFVDDCPRLPTLLYEFSLYHYVEGLRWAGSSYAYHSLGSTLVIHHHHYAQVRGFPQRAGAEDFYVLNKLAKTGAILSLNKPTINIEARHSDRVPFGTGPASRRLAQTGEVLSLYHPAGFVYLKLFLRLLHKLAAQPQDYRTLLADVATGLPKEFDHYQFQHCCEQLKLAQAVTHCARQGADTPSRLRHLSTWMDGFKTLRLIHLLRDELLGTISFSDWPREVSLLENFDDVQMLAMYARIQQLTCTVNASGE